VSCRCNQSIHKLGRGFVVFALYAVKVVLASIFVVFAVLKQGCLYMRVWLRLMASLIEQLGPRPVVTLFMRQGTLKDKISVSLVPGVAVCDKGIGGIQMRR